MSRSKFLIFLILAVAVVAWSSGDALAQTKSTQDSTKEEITKEKAAKDNATRDDQAKKFGKKTPSEQAAAEKRNRQLGLYPGIAGLAVNAPVAVPAPQAP